VTSDFVYARLHGDEELYVSGYDDAALDWWAARFTAWRAGGEPPDAKRVLGKASKKAKARDVFVYFDNDVKVRAPFDAMSLGRRLGVRPPAYQEGVAPEGGEVMELPRERWPSASRRGAPPRKSPRARRQ